MTHFPISLNMRILTLAYAASIALAAECTVNDLSALSESGVECAKAAQLTSTDLTTSNSEVLAKICSTKECANYFSKIQSLTCTVNGQSVNKGVVGCAASGAAHVAIGTTVLLVTSASLL